MDEFLTRFLDLAPAVRNLHKDVGGDMKAPEFVQLYLDTICTNPVAKRQFQTYVFGHVDVRSIVLQVMQHFNDSEKSIRAIVAEKKALRGGNAPVTSVEQERQENKYEVFDCKEAHSDAVELVEETVRSLYDTIIETLCLVSYDDDDDEDNDNAPFLTEMSKMEVLLDFSAFLDNIGLDLANELRNCYGTERLIDFLDSVPRLATDDDGMHMCRQVAWGRRLLGYGNQSYDHDEESFKKLRALFEQVVPMPTSLSLANIQSQIAACPL